jgi:putative transposase
VAGGDLDEGTRLAAATGAWVCFEDEAGQALRPGKARTWAPRGRTPVARVSGNSGRLSVAGMACLKAGHARPVLLPGTRPPPSQGQPAQPGEADYTALIAAAHRALDAPVILVWDTLNTPPQQEKAEVHRRPRRVAHGGPPARLRPRPQRH